MKNYFLMFPAILLILFSSSLSAGTFNKFVNAEHKQNMELKNAVKSAFELSDQPPIYAGTNLLDKNSNDYAECKSVYKLIVALRDKIIQHYQAELWLPS